MHFEFPFFFREELERYSLSIGTSFERGCIDLALQMWDQAVNCSSCLKLSDFANEDHVLYYYFTGPCGKNFCTLVLMVTCSYSNCVVCLCHWCGVHDMWTLRATLRCVQSNSCTLHCFEAENWDRTSRAECIRRLVRCKYYMYLWHWCRNSIHSVFCENSEERCWVCSWCSHLL